LDCLPGIVLLLVDVGSRDMGRRRGELPPPPWSPLGTAFAEYGRIAKTLHLLRVVDPVDDIYRPQVNRQLAVQESRHKLALDICHGKRGQIMLAYRTGQEDQLGALGLVLNAAALWTTRYLDAAVEQLRALPAEPREHDVLNEDVARLSPLKHANLNVRDRYSFRLRPGWRRPAAPARPGHGRRGRGGMSSRCVQLAAASPYAARHRFGRRLSVHSERQKKRARSLRAPCHS
jgi:hypothetical protein